MFKIKHTIWTLRSFRLCITPNFIPRSYQIYNLSVRRFGTASIDLQRSLIQQEIEDSKKIKKERYEEKPKEKAGELFHRKAEHEEFFGIPLRKKEPKNVEDIMAKLRMPFKNPDELLNFYEVNRKLFQGI